MKITGTLAQAFEYDIYTIIHSEREDGIYRQGVTLIISVEFEK